MTAVAPPRLDASLEELLQAAYADEVPFLGNVGLEQWAPGDALGRAIRGVQIMEKLGYAAYGFTDQTQSWIWKSLWTPELVPAARFYPDHEAFYDTLILMAAVAPWTTKIRLGTTIDAYRRPPGLLAQTLNTLDVLSRGRVSVAIGTGEDKQFVPYGLERTQPRNARLEEMIASLKALMTSSEPVTRESQYHPLEDALIGVPPYDPKRPMTILIAGGGPRVMKAVARAADGLSTYLPGAYADRVEGLEEDLAALRAECEAIGRDYGELKINARIVMSMLCEDDEQIRRCLDNPYTKSMASQLTPRGEHWKMWGSKHPLGDDWALSGAHRSTKFTREEALEICSQITDDDVQHVCYVGTPEDVARRTVPWLRVTGVKRVALTYYANYSAWVLPELAEPGPNGLPRWHELNVRYTQELQRLLDQES